jgi:hypothetical protein
MSTSDSVAHLSDTSMHITATTTTTTTTEELAQQHCAEAGALSDNEYLAELDALLQPIDNNDNTGFVSSGNSLSTLTSTSSPPSYTSSSFADVIDSVAEATATLLAAGQQFDYDSDVSELDTGVVEGYTDLPVPPPITTTPVLTPINTPPSSPPPSAAAAAPSRRQRPPRAKQARVNYPASERDSDSDDDSSSYSSSSASSSSSSDDDDYAAPHKRRRARTAATPTVSSPSVVTTTSITVPVVTTNSNTTTTTTTPLVVRHLPALATATGGVTTHIVKATLPLAHFIHGVMCFESQPADGDAANYAYTDGGDPGLITAKLRTARFNIVPDRHGRELVFAREPASTGAWLYLGQRGHPLTGFGPVTESCTLQPHDVHGLDFVCGESINGCKCATHACACTKRNLFCVAACRRYQPTLTPANRHAPNTHMGSTPCNCSSVECMTTFLRTADQYAMLTRRRVDAAHAYATWLPPCSVRVLAHSTARASSNTVVRIHDALQRNDKAAVLALFDELVLRD